MRKNDNMRNFADAIGLFFAFTKVSLLTQLEYPMRYLVRCIGKVLSFGGGFALVLIMLTRFRVIGTWSMHEVLLLYSVNLLCYSLGATFAMPVNDLSMRVHNGTIDSILTKPVNPLYLYMCQQVSAGYTTNYVISLIIMGVSLHNLDIALSFFTVSFLIVGIIGGALIHAAALIASGVPAFWLVKSSALSRIFYWEASRFIDYPISIYAGGVQVILTFLLPLAFINYYPLQLFLGRGDTPFSPALMYLSPVVGIVCFIGAYRFWKYGLDAYQSTGS